MLEVQIILGSGLGITVSLCLCVLIRGISLEEG